MEPIYEDSFRFEVDDITRSVLDKKIIPLDIRENYEVHITGTSRGKTIVNESHGSFAVAYKMNALKKGNNNLCFRVWYNTALIGDADSKLENEEQHREETKRAELFNERMVKISSPLITWNKELPYFDNFEFFREAIVIKNNNGCERRVPGMKMDWIEGTILDKYIQEHALEKEKIRKLAQEFLIMCKKFKEYGISHGDLSSNNIIVYEKGNEVQIKLVDYDSMFIERTMANKNYYQALAGTPGFQHHERLNSSKPLLASINDDNFSQQVIYLSILAVALNPDIAESYDTTLLFCSDDLKDDISFKNSLGYSEVAILQNNETNFYLEQLCKAINSPLEDVKSVCDLEPILRFETYKTEKGDDIDRMGLSSDNKICQKHIANAKQDIDMLKYDSNKSFDENKDCIDKIVSLLKERLEKERNPSISEKYTQLWRKNKILLGVGTFIIVVCFGIKVISDHWGNDEILVEISQDHLVPSLEGSDWIVQMIDGERLPTGDAGATIKALDADGTQYIMLITSDSKALQTEVNFTVDRLTGDLLSTELGNGRVELIKDDMGNHIKIIFDKWIIVK